MITFGMGFNSPDLFFSRVSLSPSPSRPQDLSSPHPQSRSFFYPARCWLTLPSSSLYVLTTGCPRSDEKQFDDDNSISSHKCFLLVDVRPCSTPSHHSSSHSSAGVFITLNLIRILSIVALILVFSSSILVMIHDVQAVSHFASEGDPNTTNSTVAYIMHEDYILYVLPQLNSSSTKKSNQSL